MKPNNGDFNNGDFNNGDCNNGDFNNGDCNNGDCNNGDCNNGYCNNGDYNNGDYNIGDCNNGDFNKTSNALGCFNVEKQKLKFFDKETDMTFEEWLNTEAYSLMSCVPLRLTKWITDSKMTEEEKEAHPEYKTAGGYLKVEDSAKHRVECFAKWWSELTEREKEIITQIPNFDAGKFYEITGIKVDM